MSKYPEHDKLRAVKMEHAAVSAFLEWCEEYHLGLIDARTGNEVHPSAALSDYFGIDRHAFSAEKDAMLDELREATGA